MAGKPSAIGFGFQPFGHFPFGHADWAEEVTYALAPQAQKDDDALCPSDPPIPMRGLMNSYKPQLQYLLDRWELFPSLWDANKVPIEQLGQLAYNFNITLNGDKSEALQRAEVLNAIQFFLSKGRDQGYEIAAAFSGLVVTITPQWAATCDPGALLQDDGPTEFFPAFDAFPGDAIPLDSSFADFYERWPRRLIWVDPCRTSWLKLFFESPDDTEIDDYSSITENVINNVERVRPIHVRILSYRFDGPRAVGGGWTLSVAAENAAIGGGWSIPVTAELRSVGGGWTLPVIAVPDP